MLSFTLVWFLLSLGLMSSVHAQELQVGVDQPQWQVTLLDSEQTLTSANQKGQIVILNFWATWCEPCRREMPMLAKFAQTHQDLGVKVIAISVDSPRQMAKVHEVAQQYPFLFAHSSQSELRSLGRIKRLPSTFIFDGQGVLRRSGHTGDALISEQELNTLIESMLNASKTVANAH